MKEFLPIFRSLFENKTFTEGSYKYTFYKVEIEDDILLFWVDTELPFKGCSYLVEKIFFDIEQIIRNRMEYTSLSPAVKMLMTIDMEDPIGRGYFSYESLKKIENLFNTELKKKDWKRRNVEFSFDAQYKLSKEFTYEILEGEFYIRMDVFLSNFTLGDKPVKLKQKYLYDAFNFIGEYFYESENITSEADGIIYRILEPEIQISRTDIYNNISFIIKTLDGQSKPKEYQKPSGVDKLDDLFEPL